MCHMFLTSIMSSHLWDICCCALWEEAVQGVTIVGHLSRDLHSNQRIS